MQPSAVIGTGGKHVLLAIAVFAMLLTTWQLVRPFPVQLTLVGCALGPINASRPEEGDSDVDLGECSKRLGMLCVQNERFADANWYSNNRSRKIVINCPDRKLI